jgi:hypothetical protein
MKQIRNKKNEIQKETTQMGVLTMSVYLANAIKLIASERRKAQRVNRLYYKLIGKIQKDPTNIQAGMIDLLSNPFIKSAISILEKFESNYKLREAAKLIKQAITEHEESKKKGKGKK